MIIKNTTRVDDHNAVIVNALKWPIISQMKEIEVHNKVTRVIYNNAVLLNLLIN